MGSRRYRSETPGEVNYPFCCIGVCLIIILQLCAAFNLDVENPTVYSGPNGSYFGYSVEFYLTNSSRYVFSYLEVILQVTANMFGQIRHLLVHFIIGSKWKMWAKEFRGFILGFTQIAYQLNILQ